MSGSLRAIVQEVFAEAVRDSDRALLRRARAAMCRLERTADSGKFLTRSERDALWHVARTAPAKENDQ